MANARVALRRAVGSVMLAGSLGAALCCVTTSGSASAATGASGPIVVGGVYAAAGFPGMNTGFQARIARFNKDGGLDGRKIDYLGATDDQDSPTLEANDIQQLVQDRHVFAVTPVADDVLSSGEMTFLAQNKTPIIGYSVNPSWCNTPIAIGIVGCQQSPQGYENYTGPLQVEKAMGLPGSKINMAMSGYDIPAAADVSKTLAETFQVAGVHITLNTNTIPLTPVSNWAPYVQAILATNSNLVFEVTGGAAGIGLAAALHAAGYKGFIYNGSTFVPSEVKTEPSVESALQGVIVSNLLPSSFENTKATNQMEKDLKAIGASPIGDFGTNIGYWDADVFIHLLEVTKARGVAVTPQNLQATVTRGLTLKPTLPGGMGPLTWPYLASKPLPCTALVKVVGNTFKSVQGFTCTHDVKVAPATGT